MLVEITREQGQFPISERDFKNFYFETYYAGNVYASCHVQLIESHGIAYLHFYMLQWGREIVRELKKDFEALKLWLKERGVTRIVGTKDCGIEKWMKFIKLIGFAGAIDSSLEGKPCKLAIMEI